GSADMMHRNLDRRVEVLMMVCGDTARGQLRDTLELALSDDIDAWDLHADGNWVRRADESGASLPDYHSQLIRQVHKRGASA
ncbi:MAG: RNA degradosome polyphosphate kinase, partial [Mycobacteriales bacterium]